MTPVFIDTDVLIDYSKGKSQRLGTLLEKQENGELELFINPVVVAEFFTDKALATETKRTQAQEFLKLFSLKDITKQIGLHAGELLRERMVDYLGDALIAATCVVHNLLLATRNTKHFRNISTLAFYHE